MTSSAGRITELDEKLSDRITELDDKFSDRMTALDDKLSEKISREIAGVKVSIAKQDREMAVMKWMIATAIAGILSLVIKSFFPV